MTTKQGWQGRVYEDFEVGDVYPHPLGRTVTQNDNIWFSPLTLTPLPSHFTSAYSGQTGWGTPLINPAFTLALVMGMAVGDISQNAVNLGWDEIRLPNPRYEGDTVYAQSEVLDKRESASRPHQGIVTFRTTGMNQDGLPVITFKRTGLVYKRGYTPKAHRPELRYD